MKTRATPQVRWFAVCAAGLTLAAPSLALAEQFVLMDVTFTFTKEQADSSQPSPSHYYVYNDMLEAGQPTNWTTPVDYRNGQVHIRTEVIDKPAGDEITQWSLCYIPNQGIGQGYGCTNTGTYTEAGVYERHESMTEFWENQSIDWTQGIKEMHLVIKDSDSGGGHAHKRADHEKFFPTTVRITMVQVAAGSTYDENLVPGLGGTGGASTGGTSAGGASASGGTSTGGAVSSTGGGATGGAGAAEGTQNSAPASRKSGGCSFGGASGRALWFTMPLLLGLRRLGSARNARPTGD